MDSAGYATAGKYAPSLIKIIEVNDLAKYDRIVMAEMQAQGRSTGSSQDLSITDSNIVKTNSSNRSLSENTTDSNYSFPLKRNEFISVTSPFGMRTDPLVSSQQQIHKGIEVRTQQEE